MDRSSLEIARWKKIITKPGGKERLRNYCCSLTLGRNFGEAIEDYFARTGLTEFSKWAHLDS